jgi:hypothetical protein
MIIVRFRYYQISKAEFKLTSKDKNPNRNRTTNTQAIRSRNPKVIYTGNPGGGKARLGILKPCTPITANSNDGKV